MKLGSDEVELAGNWISTERGVEADAVARRITDLIQNHLRHLAADATGWDHLYVDPGDGRFWELTYPFSGWHGGGPPHLKVVSQSDAKEKYAFDMIEGMPLTMPSHGFSESSKRWIAAARRLREDIHASVLCPENEDEPLVVTVVDWPDGTHADIHMTCRKCGASNVATFKKGD